MSYKVEGLHNVEYATLGEGPHWDADTQSLYYVDILGQTINKYVPSTKKHTKAFIGKNVSIIIPVKGKSDEFVITYGREVLLIQWDGETDKFTIKEKLYEVDHNTENVFNDGKCDPSGRLWSGTLGGVPKDDNIPQAQGNFYSFENGQAKKHLTKIGISNGLAFDTTRNKFYYADSFKGTLDEYDFDIKNATISNGKPIYTLFEKFDDSKDLLVLDGMAIDTDGNLWVAVFNQSQVIKIDPRKPEVVADAINFPVKQITSVAFGGPNLDELYVTTGRFIVKGVAPTAPENGRLYRVTGLNVKGFPGERAVV